MNRWAIGFILVAMCVIPLWVTGGRALREHAEAVRTRRTYSTLVADATDLMSLRNSQPSIAAAKRPEPGIVGQVSDALAHAGLQVATLTNVTPDSDSPA